MLKEQEQAFPAFLDAYRNAKRDLGNGQMYTLPNEWWDQEGAPPSTTDNLDLAAFGVLRLHRNEFICRVSSLFPTLNQQVIPPGRFLASSVMSVLHDLSSGSSGMNPITEFMGREESFANAWGRTLSGVRKKPILRCETVPKAKRNSGKVRNSCNAAAARRGLIWRFIIVHGKKASLISKSPTNDMQRVSESGLAQSQTTLRSREGIQEAPWYSPRPLLVFSEAPSHIHHIPAKENGLTSITSIGFGDPGLTSQYSPALKRQMDLLTADTKADYFLFDEDDCPRRVEISDSWVKMKFRSLRSGILAGVKGVK